MILIVIGVIAVGGCLVIAIGAALLFPVFSQARAAAKETRALANLKQVNVVMQLYASANDDKLPIADQWAGALRSSKLVPDATIFEDSSLGEGGYQRFGFAMNAEASGLMITRLQAPDRTVILYSSKTLADNACGDKNDVRLTARGRLMLAFADGRCMLVKPEESGPLFWTPQ